MGKQLEPSVKQAIALGVNQGKPNRVIAQELGIKSQTVATYKNYYFNKKGTKTLPFTESPAQKAAKTRKARQHKVLPTAVPPIICGGGKVTIKIAEGFEANVLFASDGIHILWK